MFLEHADYDFAEVYGDLLGGGGDRYTIHGLSSNTGDGDAGHNGGGVGGGSARFDGVDYAWTSIRNYLAAKP